jgi:hypothetical protein
MGLEQLGFDHGLEVRREIMNHTEMRHLVLGTMLGASGLTALAALSEFQAGTPIRASDVTAKFNDLVINQ